MAKAGKFFTRRREETQKNTDGLFPFERTSIDENTQQPSIDSLVETTTESLNVNKHDDNNTKTSPTLTLNISDSPSNLNNSTPISPTSAKKQAKMNLFNIFSSRSPDEDIPNTHNTKTTFTFLRRSASTDNDNESFESATKRHQKELEEKCSSLLAKINLDRDNSQLHYEIGSIYMKLARTNDIMQEQEAATANRASAIKSLDYAINLIAHTNHAQLALYRAQKAKCLYQMDRLTESKQLCHEVLELRPTLGLAHETLGYIHRSQGNYEQALVNFNNSLSDTEHKVICLYNISNVLTALGREKEALEMLYKAKEKSSKTKYYPEDPADRNLIHEMQTPEYETRVKALAGILATDVRVRSSSGSENANQELINDTINTLAPGTKNRIDNTVDNKIESLQARIDFLEAEAIKAKKMEIENIEAAQLAHLRDNNARAAALNAVQQREWALSQTKIKENPELYAFHNEIIRLLGDEFSASKVTHNGRIADQSTGILGWLGWGMQQAPGPLVVTIPLNIAGTVAIKADEARKAEANTRFRNIALDDQEMSVLAHDIAHKLTIRKFESQNNDLINNSNIVSPKQKLSKTEKQNAVNKGKLEAIEIYNFIKKVIHRGELENIMQENKANLILALIDIEQEHHTTIASNIASHHKQIAADTLDGIKNNYPNYKWKSNPFLDERFISSITTTSDSLAVPETHQTDTTTHLTNHCIDLENEIITISRRTLKKWQYKIKLTNAFLQDADYFKNLIQAILPNISTNDNDETKNDETIARYQYQVHSPIAETPNNDIPLGGSVAEELGF